MAFADLRMQYGNQNTLINSFSAHPEYLKDAESSEGCIEFWDLGPELTRPARSLKLWLTLQTIGTEKLEAIIDHGCAMAELAEKLVQKNGTGKSSPTPTSVL